MKNRSERWISEENKLVIEENADDEGLKTGASKEE